MRSLECTTQHPIQWQPRNLCVKHSMTVVLSSVAKNINDTCFNSEAILS
jgi:hypothetical protein